MALNITEEQARLIAGAWIDEQNNALHAWGGYPGGLFVVRDMLVWFINSNGEKRDGASVEILTIEQALEKGEDFRKEAKEFFEDCGERLDTDDYECFGQDLKSLTEYLLTANGGPDHYDPSFPYKENATALKNFQKAVSGQN